MVTSAKPVQDGTARLAEVVEKVCCLGCVGCGGDGVAQISSESSRLNAVRADVVQLQAEAEKHRANLSLDRVQGGLGRGP